MIEHIELSLNAYSSDIIKKCVNAGKEDVVVFTGSGTTGAIHKLVHALQLTGKVVEKSVSTTLCFSYFLSFWNVSFLSFFL